MYIVVSYDIEDDKRRGRIHRILKSFGQWMQYSPTATLLEHTLLTQEFTGTLKAAFPHRLRL